MSSIAHLKALLRKNWIVWRRNYCCSLCEIIIPVLFAFIFVIFRSASPLETIPEQSYLNTKFIFSADYAAREQMLFKNCTLSENGGKAALAPPSDPLIQELDLKLRNLGFETLLVQSNKEIDSIVKSNDYATENNRLCFAVVMNENIVNQEYQYDIRFNVSRRRGREDIPSNNVQRVTKIEKYKPLKFYLLIRHNSESLEKYAESGYLTIQNMIDNLILRKETGVSTASIQVNISSIITPQHVHDDLILTMRGTGQYLIVLPILLPYLRLVNGIMREKEKRIKEGMKIMGLSQTAFYLSWLITYLVIFTVISAIVSGVLAITFLKHSSWGWLFLWHWEFCLATMALGILITVFFNKAKYGNICAFIILIVTGFLERASGEEDSTQPAKYWTSLGPATSVSLSLSQIMNFEAAEIGLITDTVDMKLLNYKVTYHFTLMFVDFLVFLMAAAYLDQVLPRQYGIRKHPFFCLRRKKRVEIQKEDYNRIETELQNLAENPENSNFEETEASLKAQDTSNESIRIRNLKKVYDNRKAAIDDVSYSIYQGQIFALLGHNGAGKTSTINIITGLYPPTAGSISIFGMDITTQLEDIRKIMGVCPQHDVLFDELTVKEHLELFAVFKGMSPDKIPEEVDRIILDLDLKDKRDYMAKKLSGGQKRKLSVGIAFVGGSKFILLDEPSAGMDTSARRRLWDMLRNYKHGRAVLLTTHYMDEADNLGDRIAIMGQGKILCLGRPLFLKNRFGVGYTLKLTKTEPSDNHDSTVNFINNIIPEAQLSATSANELIFKLPLEASLKFKQLFDTLDHSMRNLNIHDYGVSVTTLEEVFLTVSRASLSGHKYSEMPFTRSAHVVEDTPENETEDERIKDPWEIFKTHFKALILKRIRYIRRDKRGLIVELFLPVILILLGVAITKTHFIKEPDPLELTNRFYGGANELIYNEYLPDGTAVDPALMDHFNKNDFLLVSKPPLTLEEFDKAIYQERDKGILWKTFSLYMVGLDNTAKQFSYHEFVDTRAQDASTFGMSKINQAIIRLATNNPNLKIRTRIVPFPLTKGTAYFENALDGLAFAFIFSLGLSFIPASIITYIVKERETNVKHQQIVSGVSLGAYWFSNYLIDLVKYLIPGFLAPIIGLILNASGIIDGPKLGVFWLLCFQYGPSMIAFTYLTAFLFKDHGFAQTATFFINFGFGFIGGLVLAILRIIQNTAAAGKVIAWFLRLIPTFSLSFGLVNLSNNELYAITEKYYDVKSPWDMDIAGGDLLGLGLTTILYIILLLVIDHVKRLYSISDCNNDKADPKNQTLEEDVEAEMERIACSKPEDYPIRVKGLQKMFTIGVDKYKRAVDGISFGVKNGECFALLGTNGAGKTTTFKMLTGELIPSGGEITINGYEIPRRMHEARRYIGYCPQFDALLENLTAREHLELFASIKGIPKDRIPAVVEKQLSEFNLTSLAEEPAGTYSGGNRRKLSVAIAMIGNPPIVLLDEPSNGMDPESRRFVWDVISKILTQRKKSSILLTTHSMEEAEALSTRIGIQVNGVLKCLGSAQHIKNKYGSGYELEVKLMYPTRKQIIHFLPTLELIPDTQLTKEDVEEVLKKSGLGRKLQPELTEKGTGSAVCLELKKGKVSSEFLGEWILREKIGFILVNALERAFSDTTLVEHFQSLYRFRIPSDFGLGRVFGFLEEKKKELGIFQYSLKQTSIEQIFNAFANNAMRVRSKKIKKDDKRDLQDILLGIKK